MKCLLVLASLLLIASCAGELRIDTNDAANPKAKTVPLREGSGVLAADFDPDSIAPGGASGSSGHEHHHAPASAQPSAAPSAHEGH